MEHDALKGIALNKKIHESIKLHNSSDDYKKVVLDLHKEVCKNIKESKH